MARRLFLAGETPGSEADGFSSQGEAPFTGSLTLSCSSWKGSVLFSVYFCCICYFVFQSPNGLEKKDRKQSGQPDVWLENGAEKRHDDANMSVKDKTLR